MDWDALEPGVAVDLGPTSSTPPTDTDAYDQWVRGVIYGVQFAITHVSSMPCVVKVVEIRGDASTTPTLVAAAAASAVWDALSIEVTRDVHEAIRASVAESASHGHDWLGSFEPQVA